MAIPVALVLNELVANAVKHAGPPCRVTLLKSDDGGFRLRVSDKGQGPAEATVTDGMGTRIVNSLVSQLGGSLGSFRDVDGYTVELTVPYRAMKS